MESEEFIIAMTGLLGGLIVIFVVIPVIIYLIIKKILNDRHKERLAMIEKGFIMSQSHSQEQPATQGEEPIAPAGQHYTAPVPSYPRAEDSTVKWMFIIGGIAVGLIVSAVVVDWINYHTVMDTGGIGFSIVVLFACGGLYLYHRRRSGKSSRPAQTDNQTDDLTSEKTEKKEEYKED